MSVASTYQNFLADDGVPVQDVTLTDDGELVVTSHTHTDGRDRDDQIRRAVIYYWLIYDETDVRPLTYRLVDAESGIGLVCTCQPNWTAAAVASADELDEMSRVKHDVLAYVRETVEEVTVENLDDYAG
ncbi:hypothetical protein [Halopelagius fulvigenes]|uniref:Uncharacterized protein n=1 Tax=Halopelagius fulvigenes TaxID=1198324 RepID=A0ABD5TXI6_9EURY